MDFKKGDIIIASKNGKKYGRHPIIYVRDLGNGDFIGLMLTSSGRFADNIQMKESHFEKRSSHADPQYFVRFSFIKPNQWGPYKKVNRLTDEGIRFVDDNIDGSKPRIFDDYVGQS